MPIKQMKWSKRDQEVLKNLVREHGTKKWAEIARIMHQQHSTNRWSGKQCNERWNNHLRDDLTPNQWSHQDDASLIALRIKIGSHWVEIAKSFPGRSVNNVKNRFYALNRRSFRRMCKFTGSVAKSINAQCIKPSTFARTYVQTPHNVADSYIDTSNQHAPPNEIHALSTYLLEFMDSQGKNFKILKDKFSIGEIKRVIDCIFVLNEVYGKSPNAVPDELTLSSPRGEINARQQREAALGEDLFGGLLPCDAKIYGDDVSIALENAGLQSTATHLTQGSEGEHQPLVSLQFDELSQLQFFQDAEEEDWMVKLEGRKERKASLLEFDFNQGVDLGLSELDGIKGTGYKAIQFFFSDFDMLHN